MRSRRSGAKVTLATTCKTRRRSPPVHGWLQPSADRGGLSVGGRVPSPLTGAAVQSYLRRPPDHCYGNKKVIDTLHAVPSDRDLRDRSEMIQQILEFCSSDATAYWLVLGSDLAIALAYFAIPVTMAVVLRHRGDDIPYPWLWLLFVTFIVACGLTHLVHVWSAVMGPGYLQVHALIGAFTAAASVGTAVAFIFILPQIRDLPSPAQQQARLQKLVAERTEQKDILIREIHHRIGNQLQIVS
jgi:two-component sensor histidine kinase